MSVMSRNSNNKNIQICNAEHTKFIYIHETVGKNLITLHHK